MADHHGKYPPPEERWDNRNWTPDPLTKLLKEVEDLKEWKRSCDDDIRQWRKSNDERIAKLDERFVNQDQFWPIRALVIGLVTLILTGFVGTLTTLVYRSQTAHSAAEVVEHLEHQEHQEQTHQEKKR